MGEGDGPEEQPGCPQGAGNVGFLGTAYMLLSFGGNVEITISVFCFACVNDKKAFTGGGGRGGSVSKLPT